MAKKLVTQSESNQIELVNDSVVKEYLTTATHMEELKALKTKIKGTKK